MNSNNDLSPIYLRQNNDILSSFNLPILGPIKISSENVTEGRGLIATRDIAVGECLFVVQPSVSAPVEEVKRVFLSKYKSKVHQMQGGDISDVVVMELAKTLEQISVVILVKRIRRILKSNDKSKKIAALSILSQVGDHFKNHEYETNDINIIAGLETSSDKADENQCEVTSNISNDEILSIIHRNAFGPDYRQYQSIAQNWIRNPDKDQYGRTLGLFPLAAMINHSGIPNAVRVYSCSPSSGEKGEVMIVHATKPIKEGEEIVWSYVPTTKSYIDRQRRLKENFGFESKCHRSQVEAMIFETDKNLASIFEEYQELNEKAIEISELPPVPKFQEVMSNFESAINDKKISGETSRFLRAGMVTFFTNYFNAVLSQSSDEDDTKDTVLSLASKMHLSLASVDHGTTEHLSILHLCYELAVQQSQAERGNKNLPKFWAGQLQKAHECRYGKLGGNVNKIREIMVHSRGVLRNRDGFENAKFCFI